MSDEKGGVNINGGSVRAGRDIVGGDSFNVEHISGNANVAMGRGASAQSNVVTNFADWRAQIEKQIEAKPNLATANKQDLKDAVAKIEGEGAKGKQADPGRLEKLINTLSAMAPDIFEVATTTLTNPLAGIGLTLKKIGDKAKLEQAKP